MPVIITYVDFNIILHVLVKFLIMAYDAYQIPVSKRIFDIIFSLIALILLSPIVLLIIAALLIAQGPPLFFYQKRPGCGGQIIKICKFRTMHDRRSSAGELVADEKRITAVGRFLRRTSLDELPELINVLKGEMSIVGPRPLLVQYLDHYSPEQAQRHNVLPGITGWAQVNGRNAISWEEKFELDIWYVQNWSFWLDIRIILITIWKVLTGEGISQPGRATMDEFKGSDLKDK